MVFTKKQLKFEDKNYDDCRANFEMEYDRANPATSYEATINWIEFMVSQKPELAEKFGGIAGLDGGLNIAQFLKGKDESKEVGNLGNFFAQKHKASGSDKKNIGLIMRNIPAVNNLQSNPLAYLTKYAVQSNEKKAMPSTNLFAKKSDISEQIDLANTPYKRQFQNAFMSLVKPTNSKSDNQQPSNAIIPENNKIIFSNANDSKVDSKVDSNVDSRDPKIDPKKNDMVESQISIVTSKSKLDRKSTVVKQSGENQLQNQVNEIEEIGLE